MSADRVENVMDVLYDFLAFRKECKRGFRGRYFDNSYGEAVANEANEREYAELNSRFEAAIKRIAAPQSEEDVA